MTPKDYRPQIKQIDEQIAALYKKREEAIQYHCLTKFFEQEGRMAKPRYVNPEGMEDYERVFYMNQVLYLFPQIQKKMWIDDHYSVVQNILCKMVNGDPKEMGLRYELTLARHQLYRQPFQPEMILKSDETYQSIKVAEEIHRKQKSDEKR